MRILGGILGRRGASPMYRTIDGGHPAPYPDMTDEQLYNYETTFKVAQRTFSHPPRPVHASVPRQSDTAPPLDMSEVHTRLRRNSAFDAPRYTARKPRAPDRPAAEDPAAHPTAHPTGHSAAHPAAAPAPESRTQESTQQRAQANAPVDFSKPVRTITTKQPVDIITTRARHPVYKVHGYIGDNDVVSVFTLDGRLCENGPHFLENVPEPTQLHLNIYKPGAVGGAYRITQHATRQEADASAQDGRLACVEVRLDA